MLGLWSINYKGTAHQDPKILGLEMSSMFLGLSWSLTSSKQAGKRVPQDTQGSLGPGQQVTEQSWDSSHS